jgi:hypothetical protein
VLPVADALGHRSDPALFDMAGRGYPDGRMPGIACVPAAVVAMAGFGRR